MQLKDAEAASDVSRVVDKSHSTNDTSLYVAS